MKKVTVWYFISAKTIIKSGITVAIISKWLICMVLSVKLTCKEISKEIERGEQSVQEETFMCNLQSKISKN